MGWGYFKAKRIIKSLIILVFNPVLMSEELTPFFTCDWMSCNVLSKFVMGCKLKPRRALGYKDENISFIIFSVTTLSPFKDFSTKELKV